MPIGLKCKQREIIHHFWGFDVAEIIIDDIPVHSAHIEQSDNDTVIDT